MKFDKSKVYTAVNADELKVGSKVICAFKISDLKKRVDEGEQIREVYKILSEDLEYRIKVCLDDDYYDSYPFAYLVSEPEEKKLKWTDLKVKDVIKRGKEQAEVTYINEKGFAENEDCHICIGCFGIMTDEELEEWEKVE